jgi:uncharacterized membrane protein YqjE
MPEEMEVLEAVPIIQEEEEELEDRDLVQHKMEGPAQVQVVQAVLELMVVEMEEVVGQVLILVLLDLPGLHLAAVVEVRVALLPMVVMALQAK